MSLSVFGVGFVLCFCRLIGIEGPLRMLVRHGQTMKENRRSLIEESALHGTRTSNMDQGLRHVVSELIWRCALTLKPKS